MFDPVLLKTFLAVIETRHFTEAGKKLGLSQPTISQHIRRLEAAAGRALLARDTHKVEPTADGNVMAGFARDIVEANQRASDYFTDGAPRTHLHFGVSEDLVLTKLPEILRGFTGANPQIELHLTVGLTGMLYDRLDSGRLDLVFAKRRREDIRGRLIWRERLSWIASRHMAWDPAAPVPLVLYASPSITGDLAVEALNRQGRQWYLACSSGSLSGIRAAIEAGLGITAQSNLLLSGDLVKLPEDQGLPELDPVEFVVVGRSAHLHGASAALAAVIAAQAPSLWPMAAEQAQG